MKCNICEHQSSLLFKKQVLNKYNVGFYQCEKCEFLQTEKPFWIEESYQEAFTELDVFLADRAVQFSQVSENIVANYFDVKSKFLDYGGGVGLLTRIMRDRGFDWYHYDKYAKNIFSRSFDLLGFENTGEKFELVTSFEVLEHLEKPLEELEKIFALGENFLASTVLQPSASVDELFSWYYLGAIHGQHISFYTQESMKIIGKVFDRNYYSNDFNVHLFTSKRIDDFSLDYCPDYVKSFSYRSKRKLIALIEAIYVKFINPSDVKKELSSLTLQDFHDLEMRLTSNPLILEDYSCEKVKNNTAS